MTITKLSICPKCGKSLDAVTTIDGTDANPSKDDISVCYGCSSVLKFDEDLSLYELTSKEFENLSEELKTDINSAKDLIHKIKTND